MYSNDPKTARFGPPWKEVNWRELSYDEASDLLAEYETVLRQLESENPINPQEWWNEGRSEIQRQKAELREQLEAIRENAPDAWGELKDAFAAAMSKLSEGYHRTVRELKKEF